MILIVPVDPEHLTDEDLIAMVEHGEWFTRVVVPDPPKPEWMLYGF